MPQFGDDLYLGNAQSTLLPKPLNGLPLGGRGVGPLGRIYVYDIVLATINASAFYSGSPGSGAIALSAGVGITAVVDPTGVTRYTLDVPRAIEYVSGGNDTGVTFTARGYDYYGQPQTETTTGGSGATVTGLKTWQSITGITQSGTVSTTLTIGTTDIFGLPYAISDSGYVASVKWNETLASDAGTLVVADATTPATATTGDVRGTYKPSANASNGVRRLVLAQILTGIQCGPNATALGAFGVTPV